MRLTRVKLFGFKTFADKAEFDLSGDFVAVVGPNGSGKSNLVDAILWGLGEGNARHLRAQSGTDVIFGGSSKRKSVGFAEVSLLFDNEDGSLPIPTSEVCITRRLTRAGDSEYSINRQSCRLRDVLELLADSGLGRAGYSIVGQKEIDQALSASPEDRRAWIDEAAGVQRYRARKVESLRRLASAKDHLARVSDVVREIESQRDPLAQEAEVAKRYKQAISSLREIEVGLLAVEVRGALEDINILEKSVAESDGAVRKHLRAAEDAEDRITKIGERISVLESDLDSMRASLQSLLTQSERLTAAIQMGEQKLASLSDLELTIGEESERSKQRLIELESEVASLELELKEETATFERVSSEGVGSTQQLASLQAELRDAEKSLERGRAAHSAHVHALAEQNQREARLKDIRRELESACNALPQVQAALQEAEAAKQQASEALESAEAERIAAESELADLRKNEHDIAGDQRQALAHRAQLDGRRRGIEATIDAHEGLSQGSKSVLEAVEQGKLTGRFVPVGEALTVPKELALAIETVLGGAMNDLITDHESDAKRGIEYLKEHRAGRATFQPLPLMRPVFLTQEARSVANRPGILGFAAELVEMKSEFRPVADSLLGRVLVAESLATALKIAKTQGWSKIVTLSGEVLHSSGAVTGGQGTRSTYGLVQRKADLEAIETEIRELDAKLQIWAAEGESRANALEAVRQRAESLRGKVGPLQQEYAESHRWAVSVGQEEKANAREISKLEAELLALEAQEATASEDVDLAALERARDAVLRAFASQSADAEASTSRIHEADTRRKVAEERLLGAKRKLASMLETESAREHRSRNLQPERTKAQDTIRESREAKAAAEKDIAKLEERLAAGQQSKRELLESSFSLTEQAKECRANIQVLSDAMHQAELNRARAESKRANAVQRLMEEYGLAESEALEAPVPDDLPSDASTIVSRLRKEVRAMGDVNVGAIEAFERLTIRYQELTDQRCDIESGISDVEAGIRELDQLTRGRFSETFDSVQEAFAELFQRLFPEGSGQLQLSNPDNLLESGIDVDVQLPGKKKQRLELLSGGERSLCAAAFLFALLKVKPSPLVVLDEVDAPLDGRNVERFIELLSEFSKQIQFIVITHNTSTIAAAPIWLGVTMQEPGVSTLVPVRMPSLERQGALL